MNPPWSLRYLVRVMGKLERPYLEKKIVNFSSTKTVILLRSDYVNLVHNINNCNRMQHRTIVRRITNSISTNKCTICLLCMLLLIFSYIFRRSRNPLGANTNVVKTQSNKIVLVMIIVTLFYCCTF
jgi:hypothetical protein